MYDDLSRLTLRAAARLVLLGCAALLFAAAIWWDNAANRGIAAPPPTPIPFTDVPRGGVNTYNLHAEADPAKVARTFEMIAAAGFHWVRVQFPWEDIEVCGKGQFYDTCRAASTGASTWDKYDYIVERARREGLELIVRLDTPPDWARPMALASPELQAARAAGRYPLTGPPDNFDDYGDFVAAVAARYRDDLRFFQIWNEPNLPGEWNYREQNPAELVELLRIARDRIKAENPDAVIVFPALSPTDGRGDGVNDLEYLQGVYDAGGAPLFDIMSAQLYGLGQPPTEHRYIKPGDSLLHPIDTKTDVGRVVLLHEIMVRNGDDRKAVWVSELGWNSAPRELGAAAFTWGEPVSEELKGQYLVETIERARREWPWMGPLNVWMFRFGGPAPLPGDPTPYFQLVDFEFNPLPAYEIVKRYLTETGSAAVEPARQQPAAAAAVAVSALPVLAAASWLSIAVAALGSALWQRSSTGRRWMGRRLRLINPAPLAGRPGATPWIVGLQALALLGLYAASPQLPITALFGAIFGLLALLRPDLALLFVPITVPLYLAPKGVWDERFGLRPSGYYLPLHEIVLLCAIAGSVWPILMRASRRYGWHIRPQAWLRSAAAPALLWLVAGTIGVAVAASRGAALREWRWLIAEPLIFWGLVRLWGADVDWRRWLLGAWLGTGVTVALVGLLQLPGLDLTALLPQSACFSERVVLAEGGLRRISSVYCHPNNLGLALGRVWPMLAALAVLSAGPIWNRASGVFLGSALVCLAALAATFSKGALLGALVALLVLGSLLRSRRPRVGTGMLAMAGCGVLGALLLGLVGGVERLNPLGGSSGARVELWSAAAAMLRDHPLFGVGLDQFYHYRNAPEFGDRYITAAARATTEQFAAHPHNLVLDLLVRVGPLGLMAMAWLVLHLARRCWSALAVPGADAALAIGLLASFAAALTHGLVDNFYFVPDLAFGFWLMLGLGDLLDRSKLTLSTEATEGKHADERSIRRQRASTHVSAHRPRPQER